MNHSYVSIIVDIMIFVFLSLLMYQMLTSLSYRESFGSAKQYDGTSYIPVNVTPSSCSNCPVSNSSMTPSEVESQTVTVLGNNSQYLYSRLTELDNLKIENASLTNSYKTLSSQVTALSKAQAAQVASVTGGKQLSLDPKSLGI